MADRSLLFQFGKSLVLISVVAGAYFLLGLLGLLFRMPDDPVGIIMPSAGLALAAALLAGNRALPANVIGNFCVNAWFYDFNQAYLAFYLASALGAALSAWIGCLLVRYVIGFPNPLVEGRKILSFFWCTGPLSCLVSTAFGITAMRFCGLISLQEMPFASLSWWVSDILGVLIFTPLILILFAEPQHIWYRRRKAVGLPILLTFSLVVALFFFLENVAKDQYGEQLKEKTLSLSEALKGRIQLDIAAIHALRNFILGAQEIKPQEFSLLTTQTLLTFNEFQSVSWVKLTENKLDNDQVITVINNKSNIKPDKPLPIPLDLKQQLLENPTKAQADVLVAVDNGFKLYTPILRGLGRNEKNLGVLVTTVAMDSLVQQTLAVLNTAHCPVTVSTPQTAMSSAKIIYSNADGLEHKPCQKYSIAVAGQTWLLSFYHDWNNEKTIGQESNEWIILSGFWFAGILGIALLYLTGRNFRTEALIDERTKILTETKIAAEQANAAKNQFLAKISHELRTPLNGISGFTQLLEKKPSLSAEDKKQVAIIKQCSDDLLRLINDILDISAIESRQIKLDISEFNFTLLLTDSIRICKFRGDRKNVKLLTKNTCLPRKFLGDEKRIRQILVNLIDNAVKYTNQGSVTVIASYQEGLLKISVADTGTGIAQNDLERIFSPFVQVNSDGFTREGIGLGLSITKELVNLMNGDLTVNSQVGVGSIFTVSLPLPISDKNMLRAVQDMPIAEAGVNDASVLVVDDSEVNLIFLVSLLGQLGCTVDSAKDGKEALALFGQNQYDFALIDINMPIMNGLELVKLLRNQDCQIKLVAVSAYADDGKINEALEAGFDAYITKPIEERQLLDLIQASAG